MTDKFLELLNSGDEDALRRWKRILKIRAVTGKGYLFFVDKTNRANPQMYKDHGLEVKASKTKTTHSLVFCHLRMPANLTNGLKTTQCLFLLFFWIV